MPLWRKELLGVRIEDKTGYTVGIVTKGELGISQSSKKTFPYVLAKGQALGDLLERIFDPNYRLGISSLKAATP